MFPGKAHAVGEKDTVVEHGKCRHDQTPDAEPYIVTVNLGAGGKSAAEMRGEPDKGNTKDDGIGAGAGRRFFMHLSVCLPFFQLLHCKGQHFFCYFVWVMSDIGHFRDAVHTFLPLFFRNLNLFQRGRKLQLLV